MEDVPMESGGSEWTPCFLNSYVAGSKLSLRLGQWVVSKAKEYKGHNK